MLKHTIKVLDLPLHTPFAIASGTMHTAGCIIVTLTEGENHTGIGEAAPFSAVSGENLGESADRIDQFISRHKSKSSVAMLRAASTELAGDPPALCAVECAIVDLLARQQDLPLWRIFGSPGNTLQQKIETDLTVPVMPPASVKGFLDRFKQHRFRTWKVKVSGNIHDDVSTVAAVKEWAAMNLLHAEPAILLDGNQGYNLNSAMALLHEVKGMGIKPLCFEQPLPRDNWKDLAALSNLTEIPLLLDESVTKASDVARARDMIPGCMINIKITKSGVCESLRMIAAARAARMGMMIGGMLETEIAMGFSLHMVAGLRCFDFIDLDTPFFIKQRMTRNSPWAQSTSILSIPSGPGLGQDVA